MVGSSSQWLLFLSELKAFEASAKSKTLASSCLKSRTSDPALERLAGLMAEKIAFLASNNSSNHSSYCNRANA